MLDMKLSDLFWLLLINLLLFEMTIQSMTGFTYIDEAATILLAIKAILALRDEPQKKLNPDAARMLGCLAAIVFIGLASNFVAGVTVNLKPILIDLFACVKFPIALVSAYVVFRDNDNLCRLFMGEAKVLLAVLLFFGILNLFVQVGDFGVDPRYGLRASFKFVFGHPETLNLAVVGMLLVLVSEVKRNRPWIVVALIVMCLSLRSKAFAFVAIVWLLLSTWGKSGKLRGYQIVVGLLAAGLLGYDQFSYYFSVEGGARNQLTRVGSIVANRFFPLGSGFATYASNITAEPAYYSSLYYEYGLCTIDGLAPGKVTYLSDVFWPIVIGQFGWIGLILFCAMLVFLAMFAYRASGTAGCRLACILCFVYLLISTAAGTSFFHPVAVYLACCLGLVVAAGEVHETSSPDCLRG